MNYIGLNTCDAANGPGNRVTLFVSGCTLHCKGCFNPESWDFAAGQAFTEATKQKILVALSDEFISGFSLLGGDPFESEHEAVLLDLLKAIKQQHPDKDIWAWTGRKLEKIESSPLLDYIDVLVDGPYKEKLKLPIGSNKYYGSSNQRVLYLNQLLER